MDSAIHLSYNPALIVERSKYSLVTLRFFHSYSTELHNIVKDLEQRVHKLNEGKIINSAIMEENLNLKNDLNVRF